MRRACIHAIHTCDPYMQYTCALYAHCICICMGRRMYIACALRGARLIFLAIDVHRMCTCIACIACTRQIFLVLLTLVLFSTIIYFFEGPRLGSTYCPVRRCPSAAAPRPLPLGRCPSATATSPLLIVRAHA